MENTDKNKKNFNPINIRFVLSNAKKVCPKCLNSIKLVSSIFESPLNGWLLPEEYACEVCGYVGPIALEISQSDQKNHNNIQSEKKDERHGQ